ncbi:GNAT family N-acetyltransferase [Rathayibacter caricis]|uniref:GNAT family N-acetyltransferase n=1 Tax=Rathayibacter caricis TaxID=110936 RepID=UPI001473A162|nr:GNAT family N-acetyltransferase [Rathayibacter caricis]
MAVPAEWIHLPALQRFICARPERAEFRGGRRSYHPTPWALDVQSHLRSLRLPLPPSESLLVDLDEQGEVIAACHSGYDSDGDVLLVFAIGVRPDHQGAGLAMNLLSQVIGSVGPGRPDLVARIDVRNARSQRLFAGAGFEDTGARSGDDLALWARSSSDPLG